MKFRKYFVAFGLCAMLGGVISPVTASAHHGGGHHGNGNGYRNTSYAVCTIQNCHKTYNHKHNGTTYGSRCVAYGHNNCYY